MKSISSLLLLPVFCLFLTCASAFAASHARHDYSLTRPDISPAVVKIGEEVTISATLTDKVDGAERAPCPGFEINLTINWHGKLGISHYSATTGPGGTAVFKVIVPLDAPKGGKPHVVVRSATRLNGCNGTEAIFKIAL
jgi:hypothetical protein